MCLKTGDLDLDLQSKIGLVYSQKRPLLVKGGNYTNNTGSCYKQPSQNKLTDERANQVS